MEPDFLDKILNRKHVRQNAEKGTSTSSRDYYANPVLLYARELYLLLHITE